MSTLTRGIQGTILFCTLFGIPFLYEVYPVLPGPIFYSVTFGWILFVIDSALTFVRPKASYYLGLALAALALAATVSQPQHYALVASGELLPTLTILIGSASEVVLIALVVVYFVDSRRKDPWATAANLDA